MPKRSHAEAFIHFSSLIVNLFSPDNQNEVKRIFHEWDKEQKITTKRTKKRVGNQEQIKEQIEFYLTIQQVPQFSISDENFNTVENSARTILQLMESDKTQQNTLLRSAIHQGKGLKTILSFCESKKMFIQKLKDFEIKISPSYAYFLIQLHTLFSPHVLFSNCAMPIGFVRTNLKYIKIYIDSVNKPSFETEMTFGSQSPQS